MARYYTADELKTLVLDQVNRIKKLDPLFDESDADIAYDEALRDVGYDFPLSTDADLGLKNKWIIKRMWRAFAEQLKLRYAPLFDAGDLKAEQIFKHWQAVVQDFDKEFTEAKQAVDTASLFSSSEDLFGSNIVVAPGFQEDMIGQSVEERT